MVNISIIRVNFTSENILPDGNIFGKMGEHNANVLEITPPAEMSANESIALYCVAFEVGRDFIKNVVRSEMIAKAATISVPLWHQTTVGESVKFQLEAYDGENNLLVKSQLVEGVFLPSVSGVQSAGEYGCNGMAASVAANTLSRHTHENKDIIDKLSEDNGTLTYNGKTIGGSGERPTATKTFSFDETILYPDSMTISECLTVISTDAIEDIPVGTEIKTIEFKRENGEWVDIHGMFEIDDVPYILNMHKAYFSEQYQVYFYAMVSFPNGINSIANEVGNYMITATRITYYTD